MYIKVFVSVYFIERLQILSPTYLIQSILSLKRYFFFFRGCLSIDLSSQVIIFYCLTMKLKGYGHDFGEK